MNKKCINKIKLVPAAGALAMGLALGISLRRGGFCYSGAGAGAARGFEEVAPVDSPG